MGVSENTQKCPNPMDEALPWLPLQPRFERPQEVVFFRGTVYRLIKLLSLGQNNFAVLRRFRSQEWHDAEVALGTDCQAVRLAISILCDLACQGWNVRLVEESIELCRPIARNGQDDEKNRVRQALRIARDEQLTGRAIREFIEHMETRRLRLDGWYSIRSLMRDGRELSRELRRIATLSQGERPEALRQVVRPYLQFVTEGARCAHTGFLLSDIWRYFRYTWLNPARSTPGRSMMILVRDAAAPNHPVVGIAALSSSIVQQGERDKWIGWDKDSILQKLEQGPPREWAKWVWDALQHLEEGIYKADFLEEEVLTTDDLCSPTGNAVTRLRELGKRERQLHQNHARNLGYKQHQDGNDWVQLVCSHLYRSKRANTLALLLQVRRDFLNEGFTQPCTVAFRKACHSSKFREAVGRVVRQVKAMHVGINMMDISVAGAIAPYNELLGGKLVSLLLASPEVREAYSDRYRHAASVIASGMKGEPVQRRPDLVLLCTTGLFGSGSSQYNRVRLPAKSAGGGEGEIYFLRLKHNTAYGTFHFSESTLEQMKIYVEQYHNGSEVHSIFGEGVNPKMRKIRESLYKLNFPDDELLKTGSPRALYVIPLAHNFREILAGRSRRPDYILPGDNPQKATELIVDFWRERWLSGRILQDDVVKRVERHTLTYPGQHGGAVVMPEEESASGLFDGQNCEIEFDDEVVE